jgi:hypothetical protein
VVQFSRANPGHFSIALKVMRRSSLRARFAMSTSSTRSFDAGATRSAHQRPHPKQRDRTVAEVLAEQQPRLLPLPMHPFDTEALRTVSARKNSVRALRPQQLLDSAQRAPPAPAARQSDDRPEPRGHRGDCPPAAQL